VRDGVVWGKSYWAYIEVPPENFFDEYGYTLIGEANSQSRFIPGFEPQLQLHPNFVVGRPGGCKPCLMVYARFTPYAAPADVRRLMQFDLSCLTRWRPCREQADIMPVAWSQYGSELSEQPLTCSAAMVKFLGRDADDVAVVLVTGNRTERGSGGEPYKVSTVKLVQRLKGAVYWRIGAPRGTILGDRDDSLTGRTMASEFQPGARFIILFSRNRWAQPGQPDLWLEPCGAVPLTDENLTLVLDGVQKDFMAAEREKEASANGSGLLPD
jgi:hypothetical protein